VRKRGKGCHPGWGEEGERQEGDSGEVKTTQVAPVQGVNDTGDDGWTTGRLYKAYRVYSYSYVSGVAR